ncbi:MAG TPA: OmpH family outer membrane protein [Chitinophagaceae bacterium]|nr:OmpH family outer membrane protein [Chitinophagaceae bacterium]
MKNVLLLFNFLLLCLVGYLYYLHFKNIKVEKRESDPVAKSVDTNERFKIAYIDLDSLQNNYSYYKKLKADFEQKQSAANDEITALQKKYQARAMQLQQKGASMTQAEQEAAMQEISKMQQDLQEKKQEIDNELYNQNSKMKDDILHRLEDFLKQYNKDGAYSYIFSYEPGFMFYKDSALNITSDVIAGLNKAYAENKK